VVEEVEVVEVLPFIQKEAAAYIEQRAENARPFFLYLPLSSPHGPVAPAPEWQGKSGLGDYGDFVMQTDGVVGRVFQALEAHGLAENTLVVFTSDNGCAEGIAKARALIRDYGHYPSAHLRGYKSDAWEGGQRVPFVVSWPGKIKPGSTNSELICLNSLLATCAELTGQSLPENAGEDSFSILPALLGKSRSPSHPFVVHHSIRGKFAIRQGDWKLGLYSGSGGWSRPHDEKATEKGLPATQLYNLAQDLGEQDNRVASQPETAARLLELLEKSVKNGRSTPGKAQKNDVPVDLKYNKPNVGK
jgi:arylsulfatase A